MLWIVWALSPFCKCFWFWCPQIRRTWNCWIKSREVEKWTGASPLCRQAGKVGAVEPGEEEVVWRSHSNLPVSEGKSEMKSVRNCSERTGSKGFKLNEGKLRLDTGKKFFAVRVARHWSRLPRKVVDVPSLDVFKAWLVGALSNLV